MRKIRGHIGGSHTIIAEHLRAWRTETQLSESTDRTISEELYRAIRAEFALVASEVHASLNEILEEKELDLQEMAAALTESEHQCKQQKLTLEELTRKAHRGSSPEPAKFPGGF